MLSIAGVRQNCKSNLELVFPTRPAVYMYHYLISPALSGCVLTPINGGQEQNPPDQLAFVGGGPQEGRCLIVLGALLGALPAAPAGPGASSAAKRTKVLHALWDGVHYSGLDRAILTERTERRHLHPNL